MAGQVVTGYFAYHAVPSNLATLVAFHHYVTGLWRRTLRRRNQEGPCELVGHDEVSLTGGSLNRASSIRGLINASPSNTQGGSRMRESRTYGFVRWAHSNMRPYREPSLPSGPRLNQDAV
jgi:hypothetical protein